MIRRTPWIEDCNGFTINDVRDITLNLIDWHSLFNIHWNKFSVFYVFQVQNGGFSSDSKNLGASNLDLIFCMETGQNFCHIAVDAWPRCGGGWKPLGKSLILNQFSWNFVNLCEFEIKWEFTSCTFFSFSIENTILIKRE